MTTHIAGQEQRTRFFTVEEVALHNKADDCWIIIDGKVYDITNFVAEHPGGQKILLKEAGRDASKKFKMFHSPSVLPNYSDDLLIGTIGSQTKADSSKAQAAASGMIEAMGGFGQMVPYGDASWYQGYKSPYYTEKHRKVRAFLRQFVDEHIAPFVEQWDEEKKLPRELFKLAAKAGVTGACLGAEWPSEYMQHPCPGGIPAEEWDMFCTLVTVEELGRPGSGGLCWGVCGGLTIGLPPVMHYGPKWMKKKVATEVLNGDKVICLAITEPWAGSDVAHLRTTATKSPCGKFYIVNGTKKWITNGVFADYFTTAVRTGGEGAHGVSLLLIPRSKGVTTRQMNCSGVWSSGTTYVSFEDVKVPVDHLIGKENQGFRCIMTNFNHERWAMAVQANRFARVCLEESILYAIKRKTFGKPLIQHQVIRHKLAEMASKVEATAAWIEHLTYQMQTMDRRTAVMRLGGPMALVKAQSSKNLELCAREAQQIFGGLGYTRGGQGAKVERLAREVRAYAIPAGSEEIMLDLAVKQAEREANAIRRALKKASKL